MVPKAFTASDFLSIRKNGQRALLIGHRGAPSLAPENTIASFRAALDAGCDAVELDVHQSHDGALIVMHDESLQRTASVDRLIADMTLEELKRLDAGSWFSPSFKGEPIPTLEEALSFITPSALAVIEIKHGSDFYRGIEEHVLSLLTRHERWMERSVLISFDPTVLEKLKSNRHVRTGLLIADAAEEYMELLRECHADALFPKWEKLTANAVRSLHSSGYSVHPWVLDTVEDARKVLSLSPESISSNRPEVLGPLLGVMGSSAARA